MSIRLTLSSSAASLTIDERRFPGTLDAEGSWSQQLNDRTTRKWKQTTPGPRKIERLEGIFTLKADISAEKPEIPLTPCVLHFTIKEGTLRVPVWVERTEDPQKLAIRLIA